MKHEVELTCAQIAFIAEAVKARIALYDDELNELDGSFEITDEIKQTLEKLK